MIALSAFIVWRLVRRIQRNIGRQPLQHKRTMVRIVIWAVFFAIFAPFAMFHSETRLALVGGLVLSLPLAWLGLRLTHFEVTPEGRFYRPNTWFGVTLSALLIVRLAMRMFGVGQVSPTTGLTYSSVTQSSLAYFLFGLLTGYYMAYFGGLLIRSRNHPEPPPVSPPPVIQIKS